MIWRTIEKQYMNCVVQLELGKEKNEVDYITRVQQGENMAPILFLYIMQAAIETFHLKLACDKHEFRYFPRSKRHHAYVNTEEKNEKAFQVENLLYVNDRAFLFATLSELTEASLIIQDHLSKFM